MLHSRRSMFEKMYTTLKWWRGGGGGYEKQCESEVQHEAWYEQCEVMYIYVGSVYGVLQWQ